MAKTLKDQQVEYIASGLAEAKKDFEIMGWSTHRLDDARTAILTAQGADVLPPRVEPVAWVIPGDDNERDNGFLDAMAWREGEFTKPLYANPPSSSEPAGREAWQPIETAPKDDTLVLGCSPSGKCMVGRVFPHGTGKYRVESSFGAFLVCTHWMPLPAPPSTSAGKE